MCLLQSNFSEIRPRTTGLCAAWLKCREKLGIPRILVILLRITSGLFKVHLSRLGTFQGWSSILYKSYVTINLGYINENLNVRENERDPNLKV